MSGVDFKPSDVRLNDSFPPLTATMGRVEREAAAACLLLACHHHGDAWAPMLPRQLGEALKEAVSSATEPWVSLNRNPFFRPDFYELVEKGFARWTEGEGGPLEFTDAGFQALRKYVRTA